MVVVTGAAGFIGSHLVRALRARGWDVQGIDRRPEADHVADLSQAPEIGDLLHEADAVFHLAGAAGVRREGPGAEEAWWRDNVLATEAVLTAVKPSTPLVVTSSSSVYGGSRGGPSRETDRRAPRGGYARSKVAMEDRCLRRLAGGGHVAIPRLFTVAGERQRRDMALARWIDAAIRGERLTVLGSLDRRRDVTDVRDVVTALTELAARQVTGPVNVGTGRSHSLARMIAAVDAAVGPVRLAPSDAHPDDVDVTLADTTLCRRRLGFVPHTDLDDLVARQAKARMEQQERP